MAFGCMASGGTRSLVIIDDVPADRNRMFLAIFFAQIQTNATKLQRKWITTHCILA